MRPFEDRNSGEIAKRDGAPFRADLAPQHKPSQDVGDFEIDEMRRVDERRFGLKTGLYPQPFRRSQDDLGND